MLACFSISFFQSLHASDKPPPKAEGELQLSIRLKRVIAPVSLEVRTDAKVCGKSRIPGSLATQSHGELQNVVVWLNSDDPKVFGATWPSKPEREMSLENCDFHPRVVITAPSTPTHFFNRDPILYHLRTLSKKNKTLTRVFPPNLAKAQMSFENPEIVEIRDDIHPWIHGFVVVASHAFYGVSDSKGEIRIKHLPPGKYTVHLWQELLGVKDSDEVVEISGNTVRRSIEWD